MIEFIICDDEKEIRDKTINIIENFMMNYDIEYKIFEFESYDEEFEKTASINDNYKVYFLDIKTNNGSGLDAARVIREKYDDWSSAIIIMTCFSEYKYEALGSRLYLFDFINKLDRCKITIKEDLKKIMKNYDEKHNALKYEYNYTYYLIEFRHIVCIEKEINSKRNIIKTISGEEYVFPGTLKYLKEQLDDRFYQPHKSLIVNLNQIKKYDVKTNCITFKNDTKTYLVSRNKKKELIKNVYSYN